MSESSGRDKDAVARRFQLSPETKAAMVKHMDKMLPAIPENVPALALKGSESAIAQNGWGPLVCWLKFIRVSHEEIGRRLNMSHMAVSRFCATPYYAKLYEDEYQGMLAKVDDHFRTMLQEQVLESIRVIIEIRDNQKTSKKLRLQAAAQVLEMYEKYVGVGRGAPSGILERLRSITKKKSPDGRVIVETHTEVVKGDVRDMEASVSKGDHPVRYPHAERGGERDGDLHEDGAEDRTTGADEGAGGAVVDGD